jgi:phosphatidylserine/phosphatidylglycerophosphate/cardiolipin synthase-like enzyme
MQRRGCSIRLVYAMFGRQVLKVLRGAGVPLTHLAYDSDCNGIYDKYVHMKSMTISGNYAGNHRARFTWNGSANWTPVSLASDEVVGTLELGHVTRHYSSWINYLFTHVPAAWRPSHCGAAGVATDRSVTARARTLRVDPYALIRQDL